MRLMKKRSASPAPGLSARRDFLRGSGVAVGAASALLGALPGRAFEIRVASAADDPKKPAAKPAARAPAAPPAPVNLALIGCGDHGRGLLTALGKVPGANVKMLCDNYDGSFKRAQELAKTATTATDYRRVLESKDVQAVMIATPSHLHKDIALAALQAGKHVYCEAPLASTVDDARAIAIAAAKNPKLVFAPGLQRRANTLDQSVSGFVKAGVLSTIVGGEGHYSLKSSWRRAAATKEREAERNWRLSKASSGGLFAEIGIHQIDWASWYLRALPLSVAAAGGILAWADGRDVFDTVRAEFEYPNGVAYTYRATLGSSFAGTNDCIQGMNATVMMRGNRAWMIKEADAPALGWEVYATKEALGDDTGIALVANATKLLDEGKDPSESKDEYAQGAVHYACEAFLEAVRGRAKLPYGPAEGLQATVVALKANEAALTGKKITFKKEWFQLA